MCGCHFLILSSNALWRKFVKLDQGRLKLVYKGVSEGRRRRNVVHLRRLNAFNQPDWVVQPPPTLLQSRSTCCKMPCFFTLCSWKDARGNGAGRVDTRRGMRGETRNNCFLLALRAGTGSRPFFFTQGEVFANRPLTVWSAQSKVVFVHLFKIVMYIVPVHFSSTVNCHSTIGSVQHAASYLEATGFHLHILIKS